MTNLPGREGVCDVKVGGQSAPKHRAILIAGEIL
jgi:hypothetical protein